MQIIFVLVNILIYFGVAETAAIDEKRIVENGIDEGANKKVSN